MFYKYTKKIISYIIIIGFLFCYSTPIFATTPNLTNSANSLATFGGKSGYETSETKASIDIIVGSIIQYILSFLGVVFLALLVYSGFKWMKARGNDEAVKQAKDTMINASIGIIIVLGAYIISSFILNSLTKETLGNPTNTNTASSTTPS